MEPAPFTSYDSKNGIFRTYYGSTAQDPAFMKQDETTPDIFTIPEKTLLFFLSSKKNQQITSATPVADLGSGRNDGKRSPFFTTCQQTLLHYAKNLKDRSLCVLRTKRRVDMQMLRTSANKPMQPKTDEFKTKITSKPLYLGGIVSTMTTADMEILYVIPMPTDGYNEESALPPGVYHGKDEEMFRKDVYFLPFDTQHVGENYSATPKKYAALVYASDKESDQVKLLYDALIYWRNYDAVLTNMISVWQDYFPEKSKAMPVLLMEQQGNFLPSGNALVLSLAASGLEASAGVLAWLSAAGIHPSRRTIMGLGYGDSIGMIGLSKVDSRPVEYVDESIQGFILSVDMDYHDGDYTHGVLTVVAAVAWGTTDEQASAAAYNMQYFLQGIIEYFGVDGDFVVMQTSRCFSQVSGRPTSPILTTHIGGVAADNTWAKTELPLTFASPTTPICVPDTLKAGLDLDWSDPIPYRSENSSMSTDRAFKITYPGGRTAPSVNSGPDRVRKDPPANTLGFAPTMKKQKKGKKDAPPPFVLRYEPDSVESMVDLSEEEAAAAAMEKKKQATATSDPMMMDDGPLLDSADERELSISADFEAIESTRAFYQ